MERKVKVSVSHDIERTHASASVLVRWAPVVLFGDWGEVFQFNSAEEADRAAAFAATYDFLEVQRITTYSLWSPNLIAEGR